MKKDYEKPTVEVLRFESEKVANTPDNDMDVTSADPTWTNPF